MAYVLLLFRVGRALIWDVTHRVWLEDMLYLDRLMELLHDIYIVRQCKMFALEEDLFAKLIFMLRSSEISIMYTRPHGYPRAYHNQQMFGMSTTPIPKDDATLKIEGINEKQLVEEDKKMMESEDPSVTTTYIESEIIDIRWDSEENISPTQSQRESEEDSFTTAKSSQNSQEKK